MEQEGEAMSKFDAAIALLEGAAFAIRGHVQDRAKALRDCKEMANACLVLEAAGKLASIKGDSPKMVVERLGAITALTDAALLAALPDEEEKPCQT